MCKTKQKTAHTQAPGHISLELEIKICKSGKSCKSCKKCKSCKRQELQALQKLQQVAKVQNKPKDSAYTNARAPFSRYGNKDLQKWQMLQKVAKVTKGKSCKSCKVAKSCKGAKQSIRHRIDKLQDTVCSLDLDIKMCKSCKSCKSGKRQNWQTLQKLQEVATVQIKAKDSAYASSRKPFSRFGDKDLQKW